VKLRATGPLVLLALALVLGGASGTGGAQAPARDKHWVFLSDKGLASPQAEQAAVQRLAGEFPARALQRRILSLSAP
jgi:hypothetical protein